MGGRRGTGGRYWEGGARVQVNVCSGGKDSRMELQGDTEDAETVVSQEASGKTVDTSDLQGDGSRLRENCPLAMATSLSE